LGKQAQHLAELGVRGAAASQLGRHSSGENAMLPKVAVILDNESIGGIVGGCSGREAGPQLSSKSGPIRANLVISRRGTHDTHNGKIDVRRLPPRRVVARFDFRAFPARCRSFQTCWLVLTPEDVDVCLKDPGFEVDLVVSADAAAMARVWTGATTFAQAVRSGGLQVAGPRDLVRAFPSWLLLSHFAHVERPARAG
jgi:hypothetical protein